MLAAQEPSWNRVAINALDVKFHNYLVAAARDSQEIAKVIIDAVSGSAPKTQ